jgi:hypothetical protein
MFVGAESASLRWATSFQLFIGLHRMDVYLDIYGSNICCLTLLALTLKCSSPFDLVATLSRLTGSNYAQSELLILDLSVLAIGMRMKLSLTLNYNNFT